MNPKIAIAGIFALVFCFAGNAKADYWEEQTTTTSSGVIPAYFEAETMAKSANSVALIYGIERIPGHSCPADCPAHVISYNENEGSWKDQSNDIKAVSGLTSFEFERMDADSLGNIYMANRNPGVMLKFNGSSWTVIDMQLVVNDVFPGETLVGSFVYSIFRDSNHNRLYSFVDLQTNVRHGLYLLYVDEAGGSYYNSNASGGPMDNSLFTADGGQLFGTYNVSTDQIWAWKWRSSDSDSSFGLYQLDMGTLAWTRHYSGTSSVLANNSGDHIADVFCDSSGSVWVATRYGAFKYSGGMWTQLTKESSNITSNRVSKFQEDSDHRVWIVGLNEADIGDMVTKGGMSIYNLTNSDWDYYSSKNGEAVIDSATNVFIFTDQVWLQSGHGDDATSGIYVLTRDDTHTALYGQVSGTTVAKASFDTLKKKTSSKKVTIWKKYKVKKKWKKKRVYSGKASSGWYKKLNLAAGTNIKYIIKVGKKSRTVSANTGDPIRVNLK